MNVGIMIIEYISKYIIENIGLLITINLDIHPICVIEEKAMIDFSFVWFIPIIDPMIALIAGINISGRSLIYINIIIDKGAIFCQVARIEHVIHDIDVITDGNHIWHGTIPSFIKSEIINIVDDRSELKLCSHNLDENINKILEPIAWIKKYLSIASVSWNLFEQFMIGIKDSMLISRAIQVINQLFLDRAIIELLVKKRYISMFIGVKFIDIKI